MLKKMIAIMILIYAATLSNTHAAGLEIAVGGWYQKPSGTVGYKALSDTDLLDLEQDLKYEEETRIQGRVKIDMPLFFPNIYLVAAPAEFEATGRKSAAFNFGDQTFAANVDFYSKLKFDQYDIGLYYGLPFLRTATAGKFNIDLGLNVRLFDVEAQVRQGGIYEKHSGTAAIPQVYVAAQLTPIERLAIEGELRGISISGNTVYSAVGRARIKIFGPAFIAVGYRFDTVDIDESDVVADFDLQGPFAEVGLKF